MANAQQLNSDFESNDFVLHLDLTLPEALAKLKSGTQWFPIGEGLHGRVNENRVHLWTVRGQGRGQSASTWEFKGQLIPDGGGTILRGEMQIDPKQRIALWLAIVAIPISAYFTLSDLIHRDWHSVQLPVVGLIASIVWLRLLPMRMKPDSIDRKEMIKSIYEAFDLTPPIA